MQTGAVLESQVCSAPGDHHSPLSDSELDQKFTRLTRRRLPASRSKKLKQVSWDCPAPATLASLIALLAPPLAKEPNSDD
jgi:hypothetical protein